MINLFRLQMSYLFSWKIIMSSTILVLVSLISFLLFSKFYLEYELLLFNATYYFEEYYFESLNYFKIVIVLFNMFLVINGFALNKYDVFLLVRRNKKLIITSKILTLIMGSTIIITTLYLVFLIIGLLLTPYMIVSITDLILLIDLLIFSTVYLLIFIAVYLFSGVIYSILLIVVGFFISDMSLDYDIYRHNASVITKIINLVFVNIGYFTETGYSMYYSQLYGFIISILIFLVIIENYYRSDL